MMQATTVSAANCTDASLWVRGDRGWDRVDYRRPSSLSEYEEFIKHPERYTHREAGIGVPAPLAGMVSDRQTDTVFFVIQYLDGTMKIYFESGVSFNDAEDVLAAILAPRNRI